MAKKIFQLPGVLLWILFLIGVCILFFIQQYLFRSDSSVEDAYLDFIRRNGNILHWIIDPISAILWSVFISLLTIQ